MQTIKGSWSNKLKQDIKAITVANLPEPAFVYQGISNQLSVFMTNETITLPIRKQVLQLGSVGQDKILLLTRYNLICFDFLSNQQNFSLQFQNAEQLYVSPKYIYVISGPDLFCYDHTGQEKFVNHCSQNISAMAFLPQQPNVCIVAFTDLSMSKYKDVNISFDYSKIVGIATTLNWTGSGVVVGTKQGNIGYYQSKKSKWKAKSSHSVLKIQKFNETTVLIGRTNGSIQLREWQNGNTICKVEKQQKLGERLVNMFLMDFRKQGYNQLVCIGEAGTIKAYNITASSEEATKKVVAVEIKDISENIEELARKKAELEYEVSQLRSNMVEDEGDTENEELVSSNFNLIASLQYKAGLLLKLKSQNGYVSGLSFQQAIMPVIYEKKNEVEYKFKQQNDKVGQINCEILIHSIYSAKVFEVRPISIVLPRFWKWGIDPQIRNQIKGKIKFKMVERNARYLKWIKQCFFVNLPQKQQQRLEGSATFRVRFYNWYENKELQIFFNPKDAIVEINCDCLKTMGELTQDLVNYVGITDLNSELTFPKEKQKIKEMLHTIQRLSQTKVSISSEVAESINNIKFLLVKGESARAVGSMKQFRIAYGQIMTQNRNLLTQTEKKNMNTKILSDAMKEIGQFINQTANVRYGKPKSELISQCREAIKKKDFPKILQLMQRGIQL